jgi:hypothetical protein
LFLFFFCCCCCGCYGNPLIIFFCRRGCCWYGNPFHSSFAVATIKILSFVFLSKLLCKNHWQQ